MPVAPAAPRVRRDSVTALLQACTEERRRQSVAEVKRKLSTVTPDDVRRRQGVSEVRRKLSSIQEAAERKLSAIHHAELADGSPASSPVQQRPVSDITEEDEASSPSPELVHRPRERRSSVQGFIDKIGVVSEAVALLEEKIAQLEAIYQNAPLNNDKAYMEYVLSKKVEHHQLEREAEDYCRVIRHQIQSIKLDVQTAGKKGILSMDPITRRKQYNTFVENLTRMMSRYVDSEIHFLHWEKTIETLQRSRRSSVISVYGWNTDQVSNLEKIEEELTDIKKLGAQLHDLTDMFEDLAGLVESQADLLDRIDELDKGTATSPIAPVLSSDELEDRLRAEEREERKLDIKTLIKFGVFGLVIFVLLMVVILRNGRFCYNDDPSSPYTCLTYVVPSKTSVPSLNNTTLPVDFVHQNLSLFVHGLLLVAENNFEPK